MSELVKIDLDMEILMMRSPDLKVVNCAGCGELLESPRQKDGGYLPLVQGKMAHKSYCGPCMIPRSLPLLPNSPAVRWRGITEEAGPCQENAIRDLEG